MSVGILLMEKTLGDLPQAQQELWLDFLRDKGMYRLANTDLKIVQLNTALNELLKNIDNLLDFEIRFMPQFQPHSDYSLEKSLEIIIELLELKKRKYGQNTVNLVYSTIKNIETGDVDKNTWREFTTEKEMESDLHGRLEFIKSIIVLADDGHIKLNQITVLALTDVSLVIAFQVKIIDLTLLSNDLIYQRSNNVFYLRGKKHKLTKLLHRKVFSRLAELAPKPIPRDELLEMMGKNTTPHDVAQLGRYFRRWHEFSEDEIVVENGTLALRMSVQINL